MHYYVGPLSALCSKGRSAAFAKNIVWRATLCGAPRCVVIGESSGLKRWLSSSMILLAASALVIPSTVISYLFQHFVDKVLAYYRLRGSFSEVAFIRFTIPFLSINDFETVFICIIWWWELFTQVVAMSLLSHGRQRCAQLAATGSSWFVLRAWGLGMPIDVSNVFKLSYAY